MQAQLLKFLEKYGPQVLGAGVAAGKKGLGLGKQALTEAVGATKAAPLGASAIAGSGLGLGALLGDEEEAGDEELKRLLEALQLGQ